MHGDAAGGSGGIGSNQGGNGGGGGRGGGASPRTATGAADSDVSSSSSSFGRTYSRRRAGQLSSYKLKCDRAPLSAGFGRPDFYPPTMNCPEEVLNRDSCVNGYKELIDGIEEASEVKLSLTSETFSSYWSKQNTNKYKETIRKRLRVLNNALVRKRKAGQVYGVALTGSLLSKAGAFPKLRACGDDFREEWIEDLSQRKRLRNLAENVPSGYRRRILFETLIKHDVPLLRATWFVKIVYLDEVRPISGGGPDESQSKRVELWTKDFLEYAQSVLDEFCQASTSLYSSNRKHQQEGGESEREGAEVDLQAKWRYMVRLAQWHNSEGLIHRVQLVDWVLKQLQEKESLEALQLLLPLILKLVDDIYLSQTHVRVFVDIAVRWLRKLCPADVIPNFAEQPHLHFSVVTLTELLRYLLVSVPDTFVALECFPLPSCVFPEQPRESSVSVLLSTGNGEKDFSQQECGSNSGDDGRNTRNVETLGASATGGGRPLRDREAIIRDVIDGIQRRTAALAKAVVPGLLRSNEGKVVQGLDKALVGGDIQGACKLVFDEDFCSGDQLPDEWQEDVIPGYGRTPSLLRSVDSSELFKFRFLCEWAVCEFRDSRGVSSTNDRKFTPTSRDTSRVYMAVSVLRRRAEGMDERRTASNLVDGRSAAKEDSRPSNGELNASWNARHSGAAFFASAGPMHDLIVAWLDEHELPKGESYESLQLLLSELVRVHLFWPDAYVRQLLCSGVLEKNETANDIARATRHILILRHLPGPPRLDGTGDSSLLKATRLTRNERYLALHFFNQRKAKGSNVKTSAASGVDEMHIDGVISQADDCVSNGPEIRTAGVKKEKKLRLRLFEIKQTIASLFQFPESSVDFSRNSSRAKNSKGVKRRAASPDKPEGTEGCEECCRSNHSKKNDGNALLDEEETWWLRKGQKALHAVKVKSPVKPSAKPNTSGRLKAVQKTQSLAQLAGAPIESSKAVQKTLSLAQLVGAPIESSKAVQKTLSLAQLVGAPIESSKDVCSQRSHTKVHCPYQHRSGLEGTTSQISKRANSQSENNILAIGNAIRCLRFSERRNLSCWLNDVVRNLLSRGGNGFPSPSKNMAGAQLMSSATPLIADGGSAGRWKVNEDQLAVMVYIMDVAHDFHTLVQLLLWLLHLPPGPSAATHSYALRRISTPSLNPDNSSCEVGVATLLSYLRRYEGVIAAMGLLPLALRAGMQWEKYGGLHSVRTWEINWKTTYDQRLGAELEALKGGDSEGGFRTMGMSSVVHDEWDNPTPQQVRLARVGTDMKEIMQRGINEAVIQLINKERISATLNLKDCVIDRFEEGHQYAQRVLAGVMNAINGNGASQGGPDLMATAVGLLVSSAGARVANVYEKLGAINTLGLGASGLVSPLKCARQVLNLHVLCLRLLKKAFGDQDNRMLEVALATEANSVVVQGMQHPSWRAPPLAFPSSSDTPESSDVGGNGFAVGTNVLGRYQISAAAVASFVSMVALHGITSLERMVTIFKIKETLATLQIPKVGGESASSVSRSATGNSDLEDCVVEAHVYWFQVLIGNFQNVVGGLVADLLGEANVLGLARMQRLMPLTIIFSPAYALFAAALRRHPQAYLNSDGVGKDTVLHAAVNAVNDAVAHEPFRDVCLRDTRALYVLLSSEPGDGEYAAMLDVQGLDAISKIAALVPLCARLFLHALLDRGLPPCLMQDDDLQSEGGLGLKNRFANEPRQVEQLFQVLNDLQPATYHWQWVELRLLLNEQVLMESLDSTPQNMSAVNAVHAVAIAAAGLDTRALSECEKTFIEAVLTRLLVRPGAAALYSEAVHSQGRHLEEYLISQVKSVLKVRHTRLGCKSLHQLLDIIADGQGFSVETQHIKMRGWRPIRHMRDAGSVLRKSTDMVSPEEGEGSKGGACSAKGNGAFAEHEGLCGQQFATEKALADLVLPGLARIEACSSYNTCCGFACELIQEMALLEQSITGALQTPMWLRLQFLLPLLPIIHTDGKPSAQNMRQTLAPVLLRLLGTSVVQEAVESWHSVTAGDSDRKGDMSSSIATTAANEEGLFDRLLSVLHALLSSTCAVWLKSLMPTSKQREVLPFVGETAELMLAELEHMELPQSVRTQLRAALPRLPVSPPLVISAGPPQVSVCAHALFHSGGSSSPLSSCRGLFGVTLKPQNVIENNFGIAKPPLEQEVELDPWTVLEHGVRSGSIGGSMAWRPGNLKACPWLEGTVRMWRHDLTYIGAVDEES